VTARLSKRFYDVLARTASWPSYWVTPLLGIAGLVIALRGH